MRAGFTLIELMLVMALIVAIAGLTYPALRRPLANQRLHAAAKRLRGELAQLRLAAIETGEAQQFRYAPSESRYRIGAERLLLPSAQLGAQDPETGPRLTAGGSSVKRQWTEPPLMASRWEESNLPDSISFALPEPTMLPAADAPSSAIPPADPSTASEPDGAAWSIPIVFRPDGTCTNSSIILTNDEGMQIEISLRGLTGLASLGEIELREDDSVETPAPVVR